MIEGNHVCHKCISDEFLSTEVKKMGKSRLCSYCQHKRKGYTLEEVSDRVEKAFFEHYERTPEEPSEYQYWMQHADKESNYHWYREGELVVDILENDLGFEAKLANDISENLRDRYANYGSDEMYEETEFGSESHYESAGISDREWQVQQDAFDRSLRAEARYFNEPLRQYLQQIFEGIDELKTYGRKTVITEAGPGREITGLFRARVFQNENQLLEALSKPDQHLGSPPSRFAMGGRMNARGISVFYGASNPNTALAEVRPPVGSLVAVASFILLRPVRLLNLPILAEHHASGSVFDPNYLGRKQKSLFLRNLSQKLIVPVMPDQEDFDYLPTQALADFLSSHPILSLDGIVFPSVQTEGKGGNIVLFHKAARISAIELQNGDSIRASARDYDEDDEYESYSVLEVKGNKIPVPKPMTHLRDNTGQYHFDKKIEPIQDDRIETLSVNYKSMQVHRIKGIEILKESFDVSHRVAKPVVIKESNVRDF
ncbi:RES domain-containing protein [Pedobacter psychrotolerans]|uniref:RES domain-containing protein n=1 Tax=Pedobacter psychrotolerans TaxID=1843235 RepID=A0A4R2H9P0_9SPHI|nr:RES family NAD+ phosphorylase [Pedobacter psychrotolerans]TCO23810.1 RES domain-containing protein [Pedobacter psychrotolerans]GGE62775.1 hypothetical protein GCM10011413_31450 [Pedobacter psychrotolerans]